MSDDPIAPTTPHCRRILVAGLSPAWQQILSFSQFRPGEVNRARQVHWCASGKAPNVARACAALDAATTLVCCAGGLSGQAIRHEFALLNLTSRWIDTESSTRICTTILDEASGATTELVENAAPVTPGLLREFTQAVHELAASADLVLFAGSLPQGTPPTFLAELLQPLAVPVILDARGPELRACLQHRPLLVKPNREELGHTVGRQLNTPDEIRTAARELIEQGAQWVVVSDGPHALHAVSAETYHLLQPPRVAVVNPIGCGDCLAAGIAVAILDGRTPIDAIRFGMGAAAQNARHLLPARIDRHTSAELAGDVEVRS